MIGSRLADLLDAIVKLADVARVHSDGTASGLDGREHILGLKVNIRDHGDARLLRDDWQRLCILIGGACDTHDVAARRSQLSNLLESCPNIVGLRSSHRLHGDRRVTTNSNVSNLDLPGLLSRREHLGLRPQARHS